MEIERRGKHVSVRIDAKYVKKLLIDLDWTQRDLARESGLSEPTVYNVLGGKRFTSETLEKLATALGVNPIDLVEAEGYESPHVAAPAVG